MRHLKPRCTAKHVSEAPTIRDVHTATGVSLGAISNSPAWKVYQAQKKSGQSPSSHGSKERRLTRKMLDALGKNDDPSVNISAEEAAWRYLLESATPEE